MKNRTLPLLIMLLLLASGHVVQAAAREQASKPAMDASACDGLAGMPNAPMTVESCKAMMRMGEDDPATHRPGDEAMSCEQIFAELQTMRGEGVSDETVAQTDAVLTEGRVLSAKHAAEIARQMTPSPLAMAASMLPNAAAMALMAPEEARRRAAMANLKRQDKRYNAQLSGTMGANAADISQLMDANPRLPRLSQLALRKSCEPPQE